MRMIDRSRREVSAHSLVFSMSLDGKILISATEECGLRGLEH